MILIKKEKSVTDLVRRMSKPSRKFSHQTVGLRTLTISAATTAWCGSVYWIMMGLPPEVISWFWIAVCPVAYGISEFRRLEKLKRAKLSEDQGVLQKLPVAPNKDEFEQRFEQASFLAKVSHELRTPIHNILGLLQILQKNDKNPTSRYYLKMIRDATNGLLQTINDVLDFSKGDTGIVSAKLVSCELAPIIRETLQTVAPKAFEKAEVELICDWGRELPPLITTDSIRLKQVLVNLLGNAIKFTQKGEIRLKLEVDELSLKISVIDSGIGIPESKLKSVFEPFSQVDMTVVRKTQGTGLGLTIVKQLATALKSDVGVTSTLGKGSTFFIRIPLSHTELISTKAASPNRGKSVKILALPTDENSNRLVSICSELRDLGIVVSTQIIRDENYHALQQHTDKILILGDLASDPKLKEVIAPHVATQSIDSTVALLSPLDLRGREKCSVLGITRIIAQPHLLCDLECALFGKFDSSLQNLEGWEELELTQAPLRILIADDLPTNQLILKSMLEDAGHSVSVVSDGEELLNILKPQLLLEDSAEEFDIVLTDIQMPKIDGVSAITRARAIERDVANSGKVASPIPILAVTAHAFQAEHDRIMNAGASGVVTKPIHPRALQEVFDRVLPKNGRTRADKLEKKVTTQHKLQPQMAYADFFDKARVAYQALATLQNFPKGVPILNLNDVYERSGESGRRTRLILSSFLGCYEEFVSDLDSFKAGDEPRKLQLQAHALKGLLAEVGASQAAELAGEIENCARDAGDEIDEQSVERAELVRMSRDLGRVIRYLIEQGEEGADRVIPTFSGAPCRN